MTATTTASDVVMEVHDLALSYPAQGAVPHPILSGFSLQLKAGEVVALLGPSGVGKSSLLRVLAGLHPADAGEVRIHNERVTAPHPRSSFVFQSACLLPWLTLEENVAFGLDFKHQPKLARAERRQRVQAAIEEVGLADARRAWPAELSGGMAQRASLARGIVRRPDILLLDEPFSALDEITRSDMQELLQHITARHHTAAILVTHDIDEALLLADRILLLGGRPARVMQAWAPALPRPRDEAAPELVALRGEIVRHMRRARSATLSARPLH